MLWTFNDGGRKAAGFKGTTGDCVCRALAIATDTEYKQMYDLLNKKAADMKLRRKRTKRGSYSRTGVPRTVIKRVLEEFGWTWVPTMGIGTGCKVHVRSDELPSGVLILNLSRHITCVMDGVIQDTYDCSREGTRCVYGYWHKAEMKGTVCAE